MAVRRDIGLAGQFAAVEPTMTGRENLEMTARLFGHRPGRRPAGGRPSSSSSSAWPRWPTAAAATYSGGQRRRLDLGASLVGAPRLLLLDEPTTGLDPTGRREVWEAVRALVAGGTDVLLTTHYLDEADELADQVVVIDHGRAIAAGTLGELKASVGRDVIDVVPGRPGPARRRRPDPRPASPDAAPARPQRRTGQRPRRRRGRAQLAAVIARLDAAAIAVDEIGLRRPTLDEVFLTLTGRSPPTAGAPAMPAARKRVHDDQTIDTARTAGTITRPSAPPAGAPGHPRDRPPGAAQVRPDPRPVGHGHRPVGPVPLQLPLRLRRGHPHRRRSSYVDFLVPGYVATIVLFTGGGIAVAVAEDRVQGFTDRLLSLPMPRYAIVLGRTLADSATNTWAILTTAAFGFLFGFRLGGTVPDGLAALGLCLVYGVVFTVVFIVIGLVAPNAQAAQGMSHDRLRPGLLLQHLRPGRLDGRAGSSPSPSTSRSPRWSTPSAPCSSARAPTSAWPWPGRRCSSSSSRRSPCSVTGAREARPGPRPEVIRQTDTTGFAWPVTLSE